MIHATAIADQHGYLPTIEPCDLLLIAGDICPDDFVRPDDPDQLRWLDSTFRDWLRGVPAKRIVGIAGNHDLVFQDNPLSVAELHLPWTYLMDSGTEAHGLKVWGTPWINPIWGAYQLHEAEQRDKFALIPDDVDVLVSHGPPAGVGDKVLSQHHVGSGPLAARLSYVHPRLHVFGHVHEARTRQEFPGMTMANVSVVDVQYRHVHSPMKFEV